MSEKIIDFKTKVNNDKKDNKNQNIFSEKNMRDGEETFLEVKEAIKHTGISFLRSTLTVMHKDARKSSLFILNVSTHGGPGIKQMGVDEDGDPINVMQLVISIDTANKLIDNLQQVKEALLENNKK